ncbi:MAG: hypothetical protein HY646_07125 [Acidobacteria bacterium]|nr:hypothetical protein [Acidobacteriota bacterium]
MKLRKIVGLVLFVGCLPLAGESQGVTGYPIAENFTAETHVVELDVPAELDGVRFIIAWSTQIGEATGSFRVGRAGRHSYDMRQFPMWRGFITKLAITHKDIRGRVKEPTLLDQLDMFLEPERLTLSIINGFEGHSLFGWRWQWVLWAVVLGTSGLFALTVRQRSVHAFGLGLVLAFILMDLRNVYNHAVIAYKMERYHQGMIPLAGVKTFADKASEIIGEESWTHDSWDGEVSIFLPYRLAEQQYLHEDLGRDAAFTITKNAEMGKALLQYANYYLVRTNPH